MKRLIAAVVLIILVTGIYISSYFYIDRVCEETEKLLNECVSAYNNNQKIETNITELENYWSNKEKVLSIILNHNSIDEIELAIESLSVHSKYPQNEMFYEYSSTIDILLHQIMEDTVPSAHSIL